MRASQAAAPLAMWVKANVRFSLVIEKIQPLEVELAGGCLRLSVAQC
jgi:dynein heavy chain 2